MFNEQRLRSLPFVLILRGFERNQIGPIVTACRRGGLRNLEITMNSKQPEDQIKEAIQHAGAEMNIGAGTVTGRKTLEAARTAGASFIVTPNLKLEIVHACRVEHLPIFPGAMTPTEIHTAWKAGARMVKIFPSNLLGPQFIKALRGPFPDIPLMPTGGINQDTISDYLKAGASGFGIGSPLLNPERIRNKDWNWITDQVAAFREIYEAHQKSRD